MTPATRTDEAGQHGALLPVYEENGISVCLPDGMLPNVHDELLRGSLIYFAKHLLRMDVEEVYILWSEAVSRSNRLAIQASRDSGKSAFFSYAYAIWMAWKNPGSLGYIFSSTHGLAKDLLAIIKDGNRQQGPDGQTVGLYALEDIPELAYLVDHKNCTWGADEIQFTSGSRIRVRGLNGAGDKFINSNVAAGAMRTVRLTNTRTGNGGTDFGLATTGLGSLWRRDNGAGYRWPNAAEPGGPAGDGDFVVRLV